MEAPHRYCPFCGTVLPGHSRFCSSCGAEIAAVENSAAPAETGATASNEKGSPQIRRMWMITLIVIVVLAVGIFACCVALAYTSEIRVGPAERSTPGSIWN